jgi:hypothetical protein
VGNSFWLWFAVMLFWSIVIGWTIFSFTHAVVARLPF